MLRTNIQTRETTPNLRDYAVALRTFSWEEERANLGGLPGNRGLNMAYEALDRHATGILKDHTALRWIKNDRSARDFSYFDLFERSNRFANILTRLGVEKGDTVFAFMGRVPDLYVTALGTLKKTAVFCPLFSVFGPAPVQQRLCKGNARVLVTTHDQYEKKIRALLPSVPQLKYVLLTDVEDDLNEKALSLPRLMATASNEFIVPPTDPEDPALLHFTSGTTGMPKGALHVHRAVLTHMVTGKFVLDLHPRDVFWCTADPGWVTGTSYGIIAPLVLGVTNLVDEAEFDAARWYSILEEHKVNVWYTAPTAIRRLMRMNINPPKIYNLENLRLILSVGEPLHADAVRWGETTFGIPVLDNWWQTETGGIMISNYRSMPVRHGSMGKPLPGIEAAIADITTDDFRIIEEPGKNGHLVLKAGWPSMFKSYLNEEQRYRQCFRGDWYVTGDLANRDADGYYWFVGRADDIIKTSGHLVGPFEVESTLMEHPLVAEAGVIGKPDPLIGELIKAFIVLRPGQQASEEAKFNILAHARKKLGPAVAPKELAFIENLPKTRSGKILRRLLKARELGLPEGDLSTLEQG